MAPSRPHERKRYGGIQKPNDGMNAAQRRAAAKKAARQAAEAERQFQHRIRAQGDRWVRFQAYSSDDLLYQPIRLWLEYQTARKQKSFLGLVRDRLDLVFLRPREMEVALARFETDKAKRREELGKELGDCFDDWWPEEPIRSPFRHGYKWWSALSKLDENYRATFFGNVVDGFDIVGLPIFRVPFTMHEEYMSLDVPDYGDPHNQDQTRISEEEKKTLREKQERKNSFMRMKQCKKLWQKNKGWRIFSSRWWWAWKVERRDRGLFVILRIKWIRPSSSRS